MVFRRCTIGGKVYNGDESTSDAENEKEKPPPYDLKAPKTQDLVNRISEVPSSGSSTAINDATHPTIVLSEAEKDLGDPEEKVIPMPKIIHHFRDADLTRDLQAAVQADLDPVDAAHARHLNGFLTVLSLCHTVLASLDPDTGKLEYKAQSPDEAALVQAAADMGFVFRGKEKEVLLLQTPFGTQGPIGEGTEHAHIAPSLPTTPDSVGGVPVGTGKHAGSGGVVTAGQRYEEGTLERYELRNILEFMSAGKRMSVVAQVRSQ